MIITGAKAKIRYPKYTLHIRIPADVISEVCLRYFPYIDISQIVTLIDDIEAAWEGNAVKDMLEELAEQDPDEVWYAPLIKDALELINNLIAAIKELKDVPSLAEFINQLLPICNTSWNGIINTVISIVNNLDFNDLDGDMMDQIGFVIDTIYQSVYAIFGGLNGTYNPQQLASSAMGEISLVDSVDKVLNYSGASSIVKTIVYYVLAALYVEGTYFEIYAVTDNDQATQSKPLKIYNTALAVREENDPDSYASEAKAKIFEYENEFLCVSGRYGCQDGLVFDFGRSSQIEEDEEESSITDCPNHAYRGNIIWIGPQYLDEEVYSQWNIRKGYCKLSTRKNGIYVATYEDCPRPETPEIYVNIVYNEENDVYKLDSNFSGNNNYIIFTNFNGKSYFDYSSFLDVGSASGSISARIADDTTLRLSEMSNSIDYEVIPIYIDDSIVEEDMLKNLFGIAELLVMKINGETYYFNFNNGKIQKIENNTFTIENVSLNNVENLELLKASSLMGKLPGGIWEIGLPLKESLPEENYFIDYENDSITFYNIDSPIFITGILKEEEEEENSSEESGIEELEGEDFE
jgi:hypothetical protein